MVRNFLFRIFLEFWKKTGFAGCRLARKGCCIASEKCCLYEKWGKQEVPKPTRAIKQRGCGKDKENCCGWLHLAA
ncbi:hypothetical protein KM92DES2_12650 [uncultured Desulfovibrio sp.]|uniref:Uncharacterized protein n=1 Tax=uncultured Desulfovibrio sp. TaxID=167968 RepID=A0A212KC22_9BACT|nr:hypothetical protein KM92DES2_12650 [uncultured Desulfovibrio sp.]